MKQYNNLAELLHEVSASRKYDTSLEAAIQYQDLIGHTGTGELAELSNGDFREMFYNIYQIAYGTIDTIKYYASASNYCVNLRYEKNEAEAFRDKAEKELEATKKDLDNMIEYAEKNRQAWLKATEETKEARKQIEAQAAEIQALKAKLYDLMTK